ncbi:MAG: UDP-N-acetylglucosamine 1-carboxyvinyltransferase [Deltaproteobacteria bacterium]|nr:UDP-N-acetylglucosamine 1-carboxyvinyltransferase [Deltaproteobacteria bacterium]MCB9785613.1 UDP-N-acetylglucosamine 1-carboxyvinyltransferase [Deltaproteobacteria bacterium]
MERFVIEGGKALEGTVRPSGSKNEALPVLAACLLTNEPVILKNVPDIADVRVMLEVLATLGTEVERLAPDTWRLTTPEVTTATLDATLCTRIRASILFAGPMLGRVGRVELPPPGGDVIGRRRVDTHFMGLEALGARFEAGDRYVLVADSLEGTEIFLDEQSVTATENIVMAAAAARGTTTILNAASEPHVQGLCRMLVSMGAEIGGIGTNTLRVTGARRLHGTTHRIGPDYLEIGSFIGLAAVTQSDITITDVRPDELRMILHTFERLGVRPELGESTIRIAPGQALKVRRDLHGAIPRIDDAPWPQFPTDLMSIVITVATQCDGTVLFFEKMFEGRMFFTDSLIAMGASIILCDPHRIVVVGPSQLYGTQLESPDVRAGMALLIAGLAAKGTSTIYNIRQIDRGYERIDEKLRALGASIRRETA